MTTRTFLSGCFLTASLAANFAFAQAWNPLSPTGTAPAARGLNGAPGVFDPASDRMIVFGGRNHGGKNLNDVWVLVNADGSGATPQWVNLIPNGAVGSPPARSGHSTVYDSTNNRLIVFGGCGGSCVPALNDVWVLSNANGLGGKPVWTELSAGTPPSARTNSLAAYDPARNWLMIFGGQDGSPDPCSTVSDVWVLSNANGLGGAPAWSTSNSLGNAPPGRNGGAAVYDPVTGVLTAFGGLGLVSGNCVATNGVYTLNTNPSPFLSSWQIISPDGTPPPPRSFASAVYDATGGRMLIFGGVGASGNYLSDVWTLANATGLGTPLWSILNTKGTPPLGRSGHIAIFDSASRRMTIFGGGYAGGFLNDTWELTSPGVAGLSCSASQTIPSIVDAAGLAELVGDVVLKCTGGIPTPENESIPEYTISLTLNTNITSRSLPEASELSEALLIIDDAFPANPIPSNAVRGSATPPQILCKPLGSNCVEKGSGGSPSPYQAQPNVFAATQVSGTELQWKIPIDPPGVNNTRTIRLTNVRANVAELGVPTILAPLTVRATVGIQGNKTVPLSNASPLVGNSIPANAATVTTTSIPQCPPHNAVLLGKTGTAAFDFSVQLKESFIGEYQYRNYGTALFGPEFPPALSEQNVPGFHYFTETGFYSPSLFTPAPTLGLADFGKRILISVGPLSAGMELFVPTTVTLTGEYAPGSLAGELQLVQADQNGKSADGYEPVASTATIGGTPVAEASLNGTTAYAVYEVIYADPTVQESGTIPFAVAFTKVPATGQATATIALAPIGTNGTDSPTASLPRFTNLSKARNAFTITACTTP
ncbi:MAG TPA: kelch repeat-containing protein [Bryobacteraceae bacterium]|jgi:hypothetical protein|nr:kelch repeat-containing protein [Bryobacteraceae bacterium]